MNAHIPGDDMPAFLPGTFADLTAGEDSSSFPALGAKEVEIVRIAESTSGPDKDWVAEEIPVAIAYNGISHTVMMTTPTMLEDFAVGFTLAEGIVSSLSEIHDITVMDGCRGGKTVELTISSEAFWKLKDHRRSIAGRTGCGICGVESLTDAVRPTPQVPFTQTFDLAHYRGALDYLQHIEKLGSLTGCTHAAAWVHPDGSLAGGAEDVGRHVALDKLLGLRARSGWKDGALVISSRASYEMIQKAAMCGVEIVLAVSAPTALAIEVARKAGVTLVAFCRRSKANVYTHPERLIGLGSRA
ncbi:formate dehydrogenase accessory sulfurtransferase FdhD [Sutterella sp.]|uniref:formate dehydrogenase accessory sulfurtransferase FdhD n=1 Tax=Sutterella sp. TaxID=1981025 RepID=UPI0026DF0655|nr:formate dehydrogenase accessory sulfurtransferase FdhD [Sutterella sp.]MDO5531561.1 formate dehydrogenase accessory sulfurtransferase FdhD [Sutterella sp.]